MVDFGGLAVFARKSENGPKRLTFNSAHLAQKVFRGEAAQGRKSISEITDFPKTVIFGHFRKSDQNRKKTTF